ncbi:TOMM precursor leader peptide-binding protein [Nonomuraea sp. NPDC059023]|uniref:TOMM precursor leader peptide-binding protein n=1 Tax=unclassified Nonomuraea TaxID=2593643 RepID=UPI0036BAA5F4
MPASRAMVLGFKRHVRVEATAGGGVYVLSPDGALALSGTHLREVVTLLDGTRTLEQISLARPPGLSQEALGQVLGQLSSANLIGFRPRSQAGDAAAAAYWDLTGLDPEPGQRTVGIVSTGVGDIAQAEAACASVGLRPASGAADLTLVFCDDYLDQELAEISARHRRSGRAWMPALTTGPVTWIGPVFAPGTGPCWTCLASRLRERRYGESCLRRVLGVAGEVRGPFASLPVTRSIGIQFAVLQAAKWLAAGSGAQRDDLLTTLWTLDTTTLRSRRHVVGHRPQCPGCGDPTLVARLTRASVEVRARPKAAMRGNGHRALPAEQVWQRYHHLADSITGITGDIERDPRSPAFVHCYLAGHNRALRADNLDGVRAGLRARSGGKGATSIEAKVGALCEAVERYSASRFGDEETTVDSMRGLGARAIHPNDCQLFHPRQFGERDRWNATHTFFHQVPEPFTETTVTEWTPVWSLTRQEQRFLPTDLLYYRSGGRLWADSNGNAAGSSLEDAIVQGFLELAERDAVAMWWYNRARRPAVDVDSFGDPWITRLLERYRELGRTVWVLDVTNDLGIPVMAAISRRLGQGPESIMLGCGAHFDPHVALRRALTELGQLLSAVDLGDRNLGKWSTATATAHPYLLPEPALTPLRAGDYAYAPRQDLSDDIGHMRTLASGMGAELLVLDQTRPDIGMPVVKVIVPGLRHFWARLGEGRLYDVPARLGWLPAPRSYDELNPVPLFL